MKGRKKDCELVELAEDGSVRLGGTRVYADCVRTIVRSLGGVASFWVEYEDGEVAS